MMEQRKNMTDNLDSLLEIPDFLKRKPSDKPIVYKEQKKKWWMPDLHAYKLEQEEREKRRKEIEQENNEREERKARKRRIQNYVIDALEKKHNTLGKMMKVIPNVQENEVKNAIRNLINTNRVVKISRRIYGLKL